MGQLELDKAKRKEGNVRSKCKGPGVSRVMDPWGGSCTAVTGTRFVESSPGQRVGGRPSQAS